MSTKNSNMQFSRFINRAIFCGTAFGMLTGCVTNLNYEKAVELVDVTHNEVIVDNLINRLKILARDSEFILADYAHHQLILTLSNNSIDDIALSESASFSKIHQMSPLLGQVNVLRIKLACKDLTSTQCIETLNDGNLQLDKEDIDLKIYFRGLSKVKAGLLSDGYDEFANLYYNYPLSEFADKSKERLSELRAKNLNKGDNNDLVKLELGRIKKLLSAYQFEQAIMESRILVRSKLSKPNKDLAQYIYAKSLQASKKRKQARGEYLKFLKQNEDSSMRDSALLNLAIIDWNLNNYSGARYFLKELLDNDATDKELKYRAYIILGRMSESENHNEDSTRMYQEAVKLSSNHKDNRYLRWR
ncbi:MAG: tetratricopeptide repeat protein, partial [Nitrospinota bacterium]